MDYASQTVPQLKEILKERGLPLDGKKADLVARLNESDSPATASAPGAAESTENTEVVAEPAPKTSVSAETADEPAATEAETATESTTTDAEAKPEKPKVLTAEERKQLAVELLTKKIKRAEKFGDEASAEAAKKDLARVEKFGVEAGTALAKEIGMVDRSFNNGLGDGKFKKSKNFKKNFKNKNFKKFRR